MSNYLKIFNLGKPFRAVCIGDSTTSQEWCHPSWIDWLRFTFRETDDYEVCMRRKFINNGRDGGTLEYFTKQFEEEIALYKPHVVIVSIGLNNLIPKFDKSETELSLEGLLRKIKEINADSITWSPYAIPNDDYISDLAKICKIYKELTRKFNGVFVDIFHEFLKYDLDKLFTFISNFENRAWNIKINDRDFLHCNCVGNQIIAEQIAKAAFKGTLSDWEYGTMKLLDLRKYLK